ncbi:glycosyltransferase family 4 protein [Lysobacter sp. PAGU 2638]
MSPLALALMVLVISAAGTALARAYALHRRLVDEPGERRSHIVATPRGGGAGPVLATLLGAGVLASQGANAGSTVLASAGLLAVAAIGAWDDHRPLSARLRLAVHVVAGLMLGFAMFDPVAMPVHFIATAALAVVLVNVWNFMDGIDGIAASQALLVAAAALVVGGGIGGSIAVPVAAACAGFLPFNLPRARIFLGDVGSGALGFAMAWITASVAARSAIAGALMLLPLSAFLVDAGMTLTRRIVRRERWWEAHAQHLYQALARRYGHGPVTAGYAFVTLAASAVAMLNPSRQPTVTMASVAVWYTGAAVSWLFAQRWIAQRASSGITEKD